MAQEKIIAGLCVLLPTDDDGPVTIPSAPRLGTFSGKRIGFLSNTKDNVEHLFADLEAHLRATYALQSVVHRTKAHFAVRAPQALLAELHHECDAVIVAAGA